MTRENSTQIEDFRDLLAATDLSYTMEDQVRRILSFGYARISRAM